MNVVKVQGVPWFKLNLALWRPLLEMWSDTTQKTAVVRLCDEDRLTVYNPFNNPLLHLNEKIFILDPFSPPPHILLNRNCIFMS